jgi:hypothetical protein
MPACLRPSRQACWRDPSVLVLLCLLFSSHTPRLRELRFCRTGCRGENWETL